MKILETRIVPDVSGKTWGALLGEATRVLEKAGLPGARVQAEWMLCDVLTCSRAHLLAYPEREAVPAQIRTLAAMLTRRVRREPLQYILGHADFYGLRLRVTPDVLIPRPETEQVVETALGLLPAASSLRVLDVGTGSGCIALACKRERPDAEVYACDVSAPALSVAAANAAACALSVTFIRADVLASDFPAHVPGALDLLVSNPPYIACDEAVGLAPEVRAYEPAIALFAGNDPLRFYRAVARHAGRLLVPGGAVVLEAHADHAAAVCALLGGSGFSEISLKTDLAGLPRIVHARFDATPEINPDALP